MYDTITSDIYILDRTNVNVNELLKVSGLMYKFVSYIDTHHQDIIIGFTINADAYNIIIAYKSGDIWYWLYFYKQLAQEYFTCKNRIYKIRGDWRNILQ